MRVEINRVGNPFTGIFGGQTNEVSADIEIICDDKRMLQDLCECLNVMDSKDVQELKIKLIENKGETVETVEIDSGSISTVSTDRIRTKISRRYPEKEPKRKDYSPISWLEL